MNAKEFIEIYGFHTSVVNIEDWNNLMERYANYKTKKLQGLILQFKQKLEQQAIKKANELYNDWFKTNSTSLLESSPEILNTYIKLVKEDILLEEFDEHFNIETLTQGKIE
mgnify:CR=1 FL=1